MRAQEIYEKVCGCEPLTDKDIAEGIEHFEALYQSARAAGPIFRLAAREAARVVEVLETFQSARKAHKERNR